MPAVVLPMDMPFPILKYTILPLNCFSI